MLADDERVGTNACDRILRNVIAERLKDSRRDDFGARRHLRVRRRVEFQKESLSGSIGDDEPRLHAFVLSLHDRPCSGRRSADTTEIAGESRRRCAGLAQPVGEPARRRHLVRRVHVQGAYVTPLPWAADAILQPIELVAHVPLLHPRRVLRLRFVLDRVVRIETRRHSADARTQPAKRQRDGQRAMGLHPRDPFSVGAREYRWASARGP